MRGEGAGRPDKYQRGFTLLELLAVIAILSLIAVILTVVVSDAIKRQRLDTAAQQLSSFIDRAYVATTQTGAGVFVQIEPERPDGTRLIRLVADNGSTPNAIDNDDTVVATETVTNDLTLANSPQTDNLWPKVNGSLELLCDTMGRAVDPTKNMQISQVKVITLTHDEMAGGSLRPKFRYDIEVFPLWTSKINKVRY